MLKPCFSVLKYDFSTPYLSHCWYRRIQLAYPDTILDKFQGPFEFFRISGLPDRKGWIWSPVPCSINQRYPRRIQIDSRPLSSREFGTWESLAEVMQHSAITQYNKTLIKSIIVAVWIVNNFLTPSSDNFHDFHPQLINWYRIYQYSWWRSC